MSASSAIAAGMTAAALTSKKLKKKANRQAARKTTRKAEREERKYARRTAAKQVRQAGGSKEVRKASKIRASKMTKAQQQFTKAVRKAKRG